MDRYQEFDLELLDYRADAAGESFRARVLSSSAGAMRSDETQRTHIPAQLHQQLDALEHERLDAAGLQALGTDLGKLLFAAEPGKLLQSSLDKLAKDEGLRIRLRFDAQELGRLPWEYAYLPPPGNREESAGIAGFLALDPRVSIVRQEVVADTTFRISATASGEIRIAALLASPTEPGVDALDLTEEANILNSALEDLAEFDTDILQPGTVAQLEQALEKKPQVFHFAGHGDYRPRAGGDGSEGILLLTAEDGGGERFSIDKLGQNLRSRNVRLVVLAACKTAQRDAGNPWSAMAPALIRHGIPAVVGMQYEIRDDNAIAFARAFYRTLARGRSIDESVTNGRLAILNRSAADGRDWGVPALYLQGNESVLFPPPPGPYRRNTAMLLAILLLLAGWYAVHIEPAVTRLMTEWAGKAGIGIGALVTLLGIWKVAASWLAPFSTAGKKQSRLEKLLRRPRAGTVLAVTLLAASALLSTTRSLYLSASDDSVQIEVEARIGSGGESDGVYSLTVENEDRVAGNPSFLNFPPDKTVSLTAVQPPDFVVREPVQKWRAWRRIQLSFPEDFLPKDLRLLRVVADSALLSLIPPPNRDDIGASYSLHGRVGEHAFGPIDFRQGLVYIGASEAVLRARVAAESNDALNASLTRCLLPGSDLDGVLPVWRASTTFVATPELRPQDDIEIVVTNNATNTVVSSTLIAQVADLSVDVINPLCLRVQ